MLARVHTSLALILTLGAAQVATAAPQLAIDPTALQALYDYSFTRVGTDAEKKGIRTDGLVLATSAGVLAEKYYEAGGFSEATRHITWSVSKSALATLVGIAVHQGKLSLDEPLSKYLPAVAQHGDKAPTIRDTLEMSSCVKWAETYENGDLATSTVLAMLYGTGRRDMASFMAKRPLDCEPGKTWEYKSGDSLLLSGVLKKIYGAAYDAMPWTELFDKIGVTSTTWEQDTSGTFVASSYLYMTPRDMAKLAQLHLADGVAPNGERLLPPDWAAYVGKPARSTYTTDIPPDASGPIWIGGAHWWSNAGLPERGIASAWPAAPTDMYVAAGHWGQSIYVIPSLDLVIVRVADDRDGGVDENHLIELALAAVGAPKTVVGTMPPASLPDARKDVGTSLQRETPYIELPGLSSAFVAKEMCSCLYVSGRTEEQCKVYASQEPMFATYALQPETKAVRAALRFASVGGRGLYHREARWRNEWTGCGFDDL